MGTNAKRTKILVTSALPYANWFYPFRAHAGTIFQTDILGAFQKMRGSSLYSSCADDAPLHRHYD